MKKRPGIDSQIKVDIEKSSDVLLVCTEGTFDKSESPDDWIRKGIEYAFAFGKNIIPLLAESFSFPDNLPESIRDVKNYQGVRWNNKSFDAMIKELCNLIEDGPDPQKREYICSNLEKQILELIRAGKQTTKEISEATDLSTRMIRMRLNKLIDFGKIYKTGKTSGTKYYIF